MILSIFGQKDSGKNTLFNILKEINPNLEKFSFYDDVKNEINDFLKQSVGISAFTKTEYTINLINPILESFFKLKRDCTNGKYWNNLLKPKIEESIKNGKIPCIIYKCSIVQYPEPELNFIKNELNSIIIYVSKLDSNGISSSRDLYKTKLEQDSNHKLNWPQSKDTNLLRDIVNTQLLDLIIKIKNYETKI